MVTQKKDDDEIHTNNIDTAIVATIQATELADTVYKNGKIYTVNQAQPWVEAVGIKDGKFLAVGSATEVEAVTGDGTTMVDLEF